MPHRKYFVVMILNVQTYSVNYQSDSANNMLCGMKCDNYNSTNML